MSPLGSDAPSDCGFVKTTYGRFRDAKVGYKCWSNSCTRLQQMCKSHLMHKSNPEPRATWLSRRDAWLSLGRVFCALGHKAAYISKKVSPICCKTEWSGQHQLALVSLKAYLLTQRSSALWGKPASHCEFALYTYCSLLPRGHKNSLRK